MPLPSRPRDRKTISGINKLSTIIGDSEPVVVNFVLEFVMRDLVMLRSDLQFKSLTDARTDIIDNFLYAKI